MAVNTELVCIDTVEKELWDKIVESAESSSTGDVLVVNATAKGGDVISDKSFAEVVTAINNGKAVLLCVLGEVYISYAYAPEMQYVKFYTSYVLLDGSPLALTYEEFRLGPESNVLIFESQDFALTPLEFE